MWRSNNCLSACTKAAKIGGDAIPKKVHKLGDHVISIKTQNINKEQKKRSQETGTWIFCKKERDQETEGAGRKGRERGFKIKKELRCVLCTHHQLPMVSAIFMGHKHTLIKISFKMFEVTRGEEVGICSVVLGIPCPTVRAGGQPFKQLSTAMCPEACHAQSQDVSLILTLRKGGV